VTSGSGCHRPEGKNKKGGREDGTFLGGKSDETEEKQIPEVHTTHHTLFLTGCPTNGVPMFTKTANDKSSWQFIGSKPTARE
jgi:hypothetical protein